jgi:hypothetical protein
VLDAEAGEVRLEVAPREAEVEERAEEHVARDSREAVEVQDAGAAPGAARGG